MKYLILVCLAASAIQAVPTYSEDKNVLATNDSVLETLQSILAKLERLDSSIIGEIVDLGVPLHVIREAIETILAVEEARACVADTVDEIGNDIAIKLADDFEIFINLFLEREEKLEACDELSTGAAACKAGIRIVYATRILQAANVITDQLNEISVELQQKVVACIRRSA